MSRRVLIAGIGNIFLGDDGFGPEVGRALAETELPEGVWAGDYGTSGMHLAFDLLDGYATTVLVDAVSRGDPPGTLTLLRPTDIGHADRRDTATLTDAHGMQPDVVLDLVTLLGGDPGRVFVLGCEPAELEQRIGLSRIVERAVPAAVRRVHELVRAEPDGSESAGLGRGVVEGGDR
ncbi:hydrogenase maturation protease [Actinopolyspora mzabensis]|uniref:Hydrogenase maturation protease n=1 Tax=Actinopolyspora mzabensis TaxID=995066 RepID=A0A1G8ZPX3_ACTMZ|nr:hydrogenase maturation protease [Actinopolyspora mzabensis]SDK17097.1 hydrogenase maturation protease [Actinopolyspora mzabensis]